MKYFIISLSLLFACNVKGQNLATDIIYVESADSITVEADGVHIFTANDSYEWISEEELQERYGPTISAEGSCEGWKGTFGGVFLVLCGPLESIKTSGGLNEIVCGNFNLYVCAIVNGFQH